MNGRLPFRISRRQRRSDSNQHQPQKIIKEQQFEASNPMLSNQQAIQFIKGKVILV